MDLLHTELWFQWLAKERRKLGFNEMDNELAKGKRRYVHFDYKVNQFDPKQIANICAPNNVVGYSFYPFIRYQNPKLKHSKDKNGRHYITKKGVRPICYAAHRDAFIYSWYGHQLCDLYEQRLVKLMIEKEPTAYRTSEVYAGKGNLDFAKEAFSFIDDLGDCDVLCLDVSGFFDNLDHKKLKEKWLSLLPTELLTEQGGLPEDHYTLFRQLTRFRCIDKKELWKYLGITKREQERRLPRYCDPQTMRSIFTSANIHKNNAGKGIPQGSPMSAVLSNIYMLDADVALAKHIHSLGGLYRRYSDDIAIIVPQGHGGCIKDYVYEIMKNEGLEISEKTDSFSFTRDRNDKLVCKNYDQTKSDVLTYLGIGFDGSRYYLKHKGMARFQGRRRRAVRKCLWLGKKEGRKLSRKSDLLRSYTNLGSQNYLTYGQKAAKMFDSPTIRKQVNPDRAAKQLKEEIKRAQY